MPDNDKNDRKQLPPVAWLLGRQLIASLKWILLYTAFGSKLDARDWMDAKVYPADDPDEAADEWKKKRLDRECLTDSAIRSQSGRDYWKGKEFWFDYLSDTGDGTLATYSIAYLCLSNLWMQARFESGRPVAGEDSVKLDQLKDAQHQEPLPRGEFLLIGGDTSYHLSDYATLHLRFQKPFNWAYEDLKRDLGNRNPIDNPEAHASGANRRPLFGIPGNHDYYDMLDGFRRQFRTPVSTRPENKDYGATDLTAPQLMLDGFKREQNTSYIALRLPFEWMLWGLDTEVGKIDERQRDFFTSTNAKQTPDKLIVATSAPTTVFGKRADRNDEKAGKAFYQLNLPRPFVPFEEQEKNKQGVIIEPQLAAHQIRLDIAGDVHQYARYWGPGKPIEENDSRAVATADAPAATNYASVVSGLGGAFHHPSTTYVDEIREQALYPKERVSRKAVAREIFNPRKVFRGGGVGVMGAVIAMILTFAAIANDSSRPAIHNFLPFIWLNLTQPERYRSTVVVSAEPEQPQTTSSPAASLKTSEPVVTNVQPEKVTPAAWWRWLGVESWSPVVKDAASKPCSDTKQLYLWGECSVKWPIDYTIGMLMLIATLLVIGVTFFLTEREYGKTEVQQEVRHGAREAHAPEEVPDQVSDDTANDNWVPNSALKILAPTLLINVVLGILGVLSIIPYRAFITPFGSSLWVFLTLIWAVSSIIFSVRYSDWLFVQASKTSVIWIDWLITWALAIAVIASLAVGLWLFGKNNLPAYLAADVVFVTVVLASFFGLIYVAVTMGGQHQKGLGKAAMALVGLWHWLLQLGVALLLLKKGNWLTVLLAIPIFFIFMFLGRSFLTNNYKKRLVTAWLAYGALMFALPPLVYAWLASWSSEYDSLRAALFWPAVYGPGSTFAGYEWWGSFGGFWQLVPLLLACIFGLAFSCIWVGWYFAVCLRFNGHNNETGGAARIERFKQFIRFRVRENDLTGYVIAVNDPKPNGRDLDVKLVDVFQLRRPSSQA
jgi:hypothetical protein